MDEWNEESVDILDMIKERGEYGDWNCGGSICARGCFKIGMKDTEEAGRDRQSL